MIIINYQINLYKLARNIIYLGLKFLSMIKKLLYFIKNEKEIRAICFS